MVSWQIQIALSARWRIYIHSSVWNIPNWSIFTVSLDTFKPNNITWFLFSFNPPNDVFLNIPQMMCLQWKDLQNQGMFNIETTKKIIMWMFYQWQVSCTLFVLIYFINTSADQNVLWIMYVLDAYALCYILHNTCFLI